jgi:hypothetical protein
LQAQIRLIAGEEEERKVRRIGGEGKGTVEYGNMIGKGKEGTIRTTSPYYHEQLIPCL